MPSKSLGVRAPSSVSKATSTVASPGNGLNRASHISEPARVVPEGKYHSALGVDAQSEIDRPVGPVSSWATVSSPPVASTSTPAQGAFTWSLIFTSARLWATTAIGTAFAAAPCG